MRFPSKRCLHKLDGTAEEVVVVFMRYMHVSLLVVECGYLQFIIHFLVLTGIV